MHSNIVVPARRARRTHKVVVVLANGARAVALARVAAAAPVVALGTIERGFQELMGCAILDTTKVRVRVCSVGTRSRTPQGVCFVKTRAIVKVTAVAAAVVSSLDTMLVRGSKRCVPYCHIRDIDAFGTRVVCPSYVRGNVGAYLHRRQLAARATLRAANTSCAAWMTVVAIG